MQPIAKERRLDLRFELVAAAARQRDRAVCEPVALALPAAVVPRSRHHLRQVLRVVARLRLVDSPRTPGVFLIPEAGDVQRRHVRPAQHVRPALTGIECVVIGMIEQRRERRRLPLQVIAIDRRRRSLLQEEVVGIHRRIDERLVLHLVELQPRHPIGRIGQPQRAVAVQIVRLPVIDPRRLRAYRLQRRVRLGQRHRRREAGVGHAPHPYPPVVGLHMLHQPGDRVVCVGRLVHRLGIFWVDGSGQRENPIRLEPSAHRLEHQEIAVVGQRFVPPGTRGGQRLVRHAIGGAHQQDRQRPAFVGRAHDHGLHLRPVAHRHHHLLEGEGRGLGGDRRSLRDRETRRRSAQQGG